MRIYGRSSLILGCFTPDMIYCRIIRKPCMRYRKKEAARQDHLFRNVPGVNSDSSPRMCVSCIQPLCLAKRVRLIYLAAALSVQLFSKIKFIPVCEP